jgi:hypothetical protein
MNLHNIPCLTHHDAPLWTNDNYAIHGMLNGFLHELWRENGMTLGLWSNDARELTFTIFVTEYASWDDESLRAEAELVHNHTRPWYIAGHHTREAMTNFFLAGDNT